MDTFKNHLIAADVGSGAVTGRIAVTIRSIALIMVKITPLTGFGNSHAQALTDKNGNPSSMPANHL